MSPRRTAATTNVASSPQKASGAGFLPARTDGDVDHLCLRDGLENARHHPLGFVRRGLPRSRTQTLVLRSAEVGGAPPVQLLSRWPRQVSAGRRARTRCRRARDRLSRQPGSRSSPGCGDAHLGQRLRMARADVDEVALCLDQADSVRPVVERRPCGVDHRRPPRSRPGTGRSRRDPRGGCGSHNRGTATDRARESQRVAAVDSAGCAWRQFTRAARWQSLLSVRVAVRDPPAPALPLRTNGTVALPLVRAGLFPRARRGDRGSLTAPARSSDRPRTARSD